MRVEKDSMGEMQVPDEALWGAQTQRAVGNFPISELRFQRQFIRSLGMLKMSAAEVNKDLQGLDHEIADAIVSAAKEVLEGSLDQHFVVDIFQTGSGTSTNMNANEVIANRAIQILGGDVGTKNVHPNDHVNRGQSSNDVIPSVMQLAAAEMISNDLIPALTRLKDSFETKSKEFWSVVKTGRTHLQDATPIRLGQEFLGYAGQMHRSIERLNLAVNELTELPLGGTAVGTGIGSEPEFASKVCDLLSQQTGLNVRETTNHFQAQNTLNIVVQSSSAVNTLAVSLLKIANDIRWLGSGPRAGFGELLLPEVQPGSSIMPGKVNPVIAESVCQAAIQVMGNHLTVTLADAQGSNFELNVMMPVAAYNFIESISLLVSEADNFRTKCIDGIIATEKGPASVEAGLAICTALAPVIGYDNAAAIAKEAAKTGETIREVSRRMTDLSEQELDRILDPSTMTETGITEK
ncbi:MAG: class II fumarate hydratase [Dehalococcoidia bacterium]